jgi:hypothetical protein
VGANLTWIAQVAADAILGPQLFVSLKLALAEMLVIFSGKPPEFISVTVCVALVVDTVWGENVSPPGESVTEALAVSPVPARVIVCPLTTALSENVSAAVATAATVGVNVTLTEQVAPGTIVELLHVSALIANSAAFAPKSPTPVEPNMRLPSPLLVTVMA